MDLLERFSAGDLDAFEALFRRFERDVYQWILRIVRDRAAAEELTVETFWRIYRARSRFDPTRDFGPWCRRFATNLALGHLKSLRWQSKSPPNRLVELPAADSEPVRDPDPRIEQAFHRLPPRLQLTATLALIEERPYQEIADALGTSIGTVKSRVFRSVRLLRKYLKRLGIEP
jgi:RNA polymerase sigma-70 factor (ECF subfamily)